MNLLRWISFILLLQGSFNWLEGASAGNVIKVLVDGQKIDLDKQVLRRMPYFRALLNPDVYLQLIPMYRNYRGDLTSHSASVQNLPDIYLTLPPGVTREHMQFFYNQLGRMPISSHIRVNDVLNEIKKDPQVAPARIKELLKSAEKLLHIQSIPPAVDKLWVSMIQRRLLRLDGKIARAFFSPNDRLLEIVLGLIKAEKRHIRLACYFMTNREILCELARARKRMVRVEVIVDMTSPPDGIRRMQQAGLYSHIWGRRWFDNQPRMHNKFFVFEENINNQPILVTGSANCTWAAQGLNEENIVVMNDQKLIATFAERFGRLKFFSRYIQPDSWDLIERYVKDCTRIDNVALERFTPQAYLLWQVLVRLYAMYLWQGQVDRFGLTDEIERELQRQCNEITRR